MICPYNRRQELQVLQWEQNTEDSIVKCEQVSRYTFQMLKCPREGCAVWYDGRCHYAAVDLQNS